MKDPIEREEAIDALKNQMSDWNDLYNIPVRRSIVILEQLPSAQPKVIYCKDCKKHNVNAGYKEDCCPLYEWRGVSYGHEHDYQYCVYGVKKNERLD